MRNAPDVIEHWRGVGLRDDVYDEAEPAEWILLGYLNGRAEAGTDQSEEPHRNGMRVFAATFRLPLNSGVKDGDRLVWDSTQWHVWDWWTTRLHMIVKGRALVPFFVPGEKTVTVDAPVGTDDPFHTAG